MLIKYSLKCRRRRSTKFVEEQPDGGGQTTDFHLFIFYLFIAVVQWLTLWSHSKKAVTLIPGACSRFVCSLHVVPLVSVGSLQVLPFPPTVQRHAH